MALDLRMLGNLLRRSLRILGTPPSVPPTARAGDRGGKAGVENRKATVRSGKSSSAADLAGYAGRYPGDFRAVASANYSPSPDGNPDPGEIVWTWVPFEEDHAQGKDRPVVLVGHDGPWLLGLMLTSKDHNNGHTRNADYVDIGAGPWDRQGRPSEVKLNRVIRIDPTTVRREGAVLDKEQFHLIAKGLRARHGWT